MFSSLFWRSSYQDERQWINMGWRICLRDVRTTHTVTIDLPMRLQKKRLTLSPVTNLFGISWLCGTPLSRNHFVQTTVPMSVTQVSSFVVPDHEELTLGEFWNELDYSPEDFKDHHLSDNHWRPIENFGNYMNVISTDIFKSFDLGVYLLKSFVV